MRQEVESSQLGFRQEVGPDDLPFVDLHPGSSLLGKDALKEVTMVLSPVLDEEDFTLRAQSWVLPLLSSPNSYRSTEEHPFGHGQH